MSLLFGQDDSKVKMELAKREATRFEEIQTELNSDFDRLNPLTAMAALEVWKRKRLKKIQGFQDEIGFGMVDSSIGQGSSDAEK